MEMEKPDRKIPFEQSRNILWRFQICNKIQGAPFKIMKLLPTIYDLLIIYTKYEKSIKRTGNFLLVRYYLD